MAGRCDPESFLWPRWTLVNRSLSASLRPGPCDRPPPYPWACLLSTTRSRLSAERSRQGPRVGAVEDCTRDRDDEPRFNEQAGLSGGWMDGGEAESTVRSTNSGTLGAATTKIINKRGRRIPSFTLRPLPLSTQNPRFSHTTTSSSSAYCSTSSSPARQKLKSQR